MSSFHLRVNLAAPFVNLSAGKLSSSIRFLRQQHLRLSVGMAFLSQQSVGLNPDCFGLSQYSFPLNTFFLRVNCAGAKVRAFLTLLSRDFVSVAPFGSFVVSFRWRSYPQAEVPPVVTTSTN